MSALWFFSHPGLFPQERLCGACGIRAAQMVKVQILHRYKDVTY